MRNDLCGMCGKPSNRLAPVTMYNENNGQTLVIPACPACIGWLVFYSAWLISKIIYRR